jgi:hypothetical protein
MNNDEYIVFLKDVLIKIENAISLLNNDPPKHIPSYRKMLGVQQKIVELESSYKDKMFHELILSRSVLNYFLNGNYDEVCTNILKLKSSLIKICIELEKKTGEENEKNINKEI